MSRIVRRTSLPGLKKARYKSIHLTIYFHLETAKLRSAGPNLMINHLFWENIMSAPQDNSAENQDQSSFTLNFNRITGGFRGKIKVESPYEAGVYVTRSYTTSPLYESEGGREFARLSVQSASPNEAGRDARMDVAATLNPHPGIGFNRVNEGVYFPASAEDILDAEAEGKRLPVGKAYALMPFTDPQTGAKAPFVVELTAWTPKPKEQVVAPENGETVSWYGGSAKIFDREAYLAASRKYGQGDHLSSDELEAAPVPDAADEDAARSRAGARAKRRKDQEPPEPGEPV